MVQNHSNFVLAIYFPLPGSMDAPFSNEGYFGAYREFTPYSLARGVSVRFVRADSYKGEMSFSEGWYFDEAGELQECGPLTADLILNKSGLQKSFDADAHVLNHPFIEKICSDKTATFEHLGLYMPRSMPLDLADPSGYRDSLDTEKIVFKPVDGAAGRGIFVIGRNEEIPEEVRSSGLEYLAQEFVDTSKGIPGIVEGMHDLRLFLFNGTPKMAYVRTPKEGSYLANIARGGSMFTVEVDRVPKSILKMAADIDALFTGYKPRFYSADFLIGEGERPYLVELNSHPGFPSTTYAPSEHRKIYFDSLLEIIR